MIYNDKYEVIIVGGGHAGCEAALSAARMGARTLMLNLYIDNTAMMPCNPSIGGPAKGHLVREIDALGGEMARAADKATQHLRWLNTSKGPAVRTLRAQCSPRIYSSHYRTALLTCPNLEIHQSQVTDLIVKDGTAIGVKIKTGQIFYSRTIIMATGTYLASKIHIGMTCHKSGPLGMVAATELSRSLRNTGLEIGRLRTDTTPRLHRDTINWDILDKQESLSEPEAFSYFGEKRTYSGMVCGMTRSNKITHDVIRKYFSESPLVQGTLDTEGPRYCPSIDDKVIKFPEKDSHPIFLEPIDPDGREVYMQNFSTSMCLEAQFEAVSTIRGCEKAHILRPGYAIEYDFVIPTQLEPWLETKQIKNLFLAGQINGTSGYEEAGAQGLIAGINAALRVHGSGPLVLGRDQAYIGVLIDDLVTKGTKEPYRMLTSRCEYRLMLRHDNADKRLSGIGHDIGLLQQEKWNILCARWRKMDMEIKRIMNFKIHPTEKVNEILRSAGSSPITEGLPASDLLCRPEITWEIIAPLISSEDIDKELGERISTDLKYKGYIDRQNRQVEKFRHMDRLKFPEDFDFASIGGLSGEGRQKLIRHVPRTLGQASRISGIPPTDIQLLWVTLENRRRERTENKDGIS
ncbi:MAG: tRNA uridine-5-carboxymethylaminomethyl(34) synthesis enzyme MnmG [Synergistaceae bacterium]|nr:tRNA uridine-5-carboxymethylaminomethyl(34) synthesis enzyme MnmG [Synergistaceae bacterium]